MYFLPKWDYYLAEEINNLNSNLFYLSSTQISHISYKKGKELPIIFILMQERILILLMKKNFTKF